MTPLNFHSGSKSCTIQQAIEIVRRYEPAAGANGFLLALFGSVLRDGYGQDIDLIAHGMQGQQPEALMRAFAQAGFDCRASVFNVVATQRVKGTDRFTGCNIDLTIVISS